MSAQLGGLRVRVAAKLPMAIDICSYELVAADGGSLPPFSAGAHIDVSVAPGITRQYSLCNSPAESHRYQIAVLRTADSRGGSSGMHERVQVGDELLVSTPRNHFPLAHEARYSLLLAGGIGITPILCMAERLAATAAPFQLHYCARSADRAAFRERILSAPYAAQVAFHFDSASGQRLDLQRVLATPQPGTHLYLCGPQGFMDAVLQTARAQGWPPEQIHYEFFSAHVGPQEGDQPFEVKLASSGRKVLVRPDQTVVQALAQAGVEVLTSCEQGVCGTCLTRVLEGVPDHRDQYLTEQERDASDQFTPCCSRAKTPVLLLDL